MKLLIVESPNKIKKLSTFLDRDWSVAASVGHICDLPERELGVDTASGNFEQQYVLYPDRQRAVDNIRSLAARADEIYLASDPDREGEAIAWHVARFCGLEPAKSKRVEFHSITREAVQEAIKSPRTLDLALVDAYKARRAVDRIFGYQLSGEIRRFNMRSAGRCQTPTLYIVVKREREIRAFVPRVYFSLKAFYKEGFSSEYCVRDDKGVFKVTKPNSKAELEAIVSKLSPGDLHTIVDLASEEAEDRPQPPFITSSIITTAASKLGFKPKRTTQLLQELFQAGHITYIRTDSVETSPEGVALARKVLAEKYPDLLPDKPVTFKAKKSAQGAHECIRPTHEDDSAELSGDQLKLYALIRNRFLASQSRSARLERKQAVLKTATEVFFLARGLRVLFEGWRAIYAVQQEEEKDDEEDKEEILPDLKQGQSVTAEKYGTSEKQTKPPVRFKLSTLTKEIERLGIGRPSTFSTIVQTPLDRGYYEEGKGGFLFPTETGMKCIELLEAACPGLLSHEYTAGLEESLDRIAGSEENYPGFMKAWFEGWCALLNKSREFFLKQAGEGAVACPLCRAIMVKRAYKDKKTGEQAFFLGCSRFPACRGSRNIVPSKPN